MSKEIYISSTPHETRLAIVENDALAEIYYERENEYTLAGSIYNGRVTRVLPGMQSSFVDIGLERDAFLYITDFMEEMPDSTEFDTSSGSEPRAPRAASSDHGSGEDRGGRGRRGGRERRPGSSESASDETSQGQSVEFRQEPEVHDSRPVQQEGAESGEQAGAAGEGSRRWRGRRGRRRGGRANGESGQGEPGTQNLTPELAQPEMDEEAFSQAPEETSEGYDLGASAVSVDEVQPGQRRIGRRDRGRGERRESRGEQQQELRGEHVPSEQSAERRADSRQDRPQRVPRGFAPSRNLYNVGDTGAPESMEQPEGQPIILPGESLSKYRKPGEDQPHDTKATAPPAAALHLAPPANLYTSAEGWDGGDVLPGETLSRRRPAEQRAGHRAAQRPANFERGSRGERRGHEAPGEISASSTAALPSQPTTHLDESTPAAPIQSQPAHTGDADYEPTEAAVSYRVDPAGPAEFRQSAGTVEESIPETDADTEDQSMHEAHQSIAHTITPAPEEPVEPLHTEAHATEAHATEAHAALDHPHIEGETPSGLADAQGFTASFDDASSASSDQTSEPDPGAEPHDITAISATGDMHSHVESATAPETAEVAEPADNAADVNPLFAPGSGQIDQELLDEEESAGMPLNASAFEEIDDLEEETLEGTADLGTMLRDMSIDQMTRVSPEGSDEFGGEDFEEDLEEETLEEEGAPEYNFVERFGEGSNEVAEREQDKELYRGDPEFSTAQHEAEFSPAASDSDNRTEPAPGREGDRRGRRDGRRDGRRGRGDRSDRNRSGGPERHRGRHSVQATNLPAISDLLKPGQEILVQIAKEPIAKKGARITSHIALPGRFLVFMPTVNHTGVSRKIESDSERRRLKEILLSEKGDAAGGFIVRTAAASATEEELRSDLRFLLNLWADIKTRSESSKSPALIYHDLNLIERILRDQVTDNFSAIWVDSETEYERVLRFLQRFQPSLIRRVKLYLKETPLFEQFGIAEEINKALRSKVWLKSGGSIVINQTEALVAIDINTGKYVGKTARLEDTIVKTNLDAIPEIVRQIRLRDLGGIIIIDFIDMDERKNRSRVMAALEEELKKDRAPSKVLQFNDFGLVAITRKRVKQSLERTLSTPCNVCQGTGMVKSPVTVANDIYIEMRKMQKHLDRGDVMLRVHPDVVKQLKSSGSRWLQEMEDMVGKTILVKSDPSLHPEQFDIH
jgi:ribonuclease E